MSTPADTRIRRAALAVIAAPTLVQAAWMLVDPAGFHRYFLLGRGWVTGFGTFDEHLARDVGAYALALGLVAAWAWWSRDPLLARATAIATLAASTPHLLFRATHLEPFGTGDAAAQLLLATQVLAPLVVLWPVARRGPGNATGAAPAQLVEDPP